MTVSLMPGSFSSRLSMIHYVSRNLSLRIPVNSGLARLSRVTNSLHCFNSESHDPQERLRRPRYVSASMDEPAPSRRDHLVAAPAATGQPHTSTSSP